MDVMGCTASIIITNQPSERKKKRLHLALQDVELCKNRLA
jgi:hypothetical protein